MKKGFLDGGTKTKKVFLGGTCAGSDWRDEMEQLLEIRFFNPVVDNLDSNAQIRELLERKNCDYCLYVITPKMEGYCSIAELIDDSNKRPKKTVFVLLDVDGDDKFSKHQMKSWDMIINMVTKNGGKVFDSLKSAAIWMNNDQS